MCEDGWLNLSVIPLRFRTIPIEKLLRDTRRFGGVQGNTDKMVSKRQCHQHLVRIEVEDLALFVRHDGDGRAAVLAL